MIYVMKCWFKWGSSEEMYTHESTCMHPSPLTHTRARSHSCWGVERPDHSHNVRPVECGEATQTGIPLIPLLKHIIYPSLSLTHHGSLRYLSYQCHRHKSSPTSTHTLEEWQDTLCSVLSGVLFQNGWFSQGPKV